MSEQDRLKWDKRYAQGAYAGRQHASAWLAQQFNSLQLPPASRALDIACGAGRNSIFLAQQGLQVDAIDISAAGLEAAQQKAAQALDGSINWLCQDLFAEANYPHHDYALIIVFRFVANPLIPGLLKNLAFGGYLMIESHLQLPQPPADLVGPGSHRFRVQPGQLRSMVEGHTGLQVLVDEEGLYAEPDGGQAALSRLLVRALPGYDGG